MKKDSEEISRVKRTKKEAAQYYTKISNYYDIISGGSEFRMNKIGIERLNIQSNDEILEIGFGTGRVIKKILDIDGYRGKVYGVDISEGMLARTMSRLNDPESRVKLICGDAKTLPFDNEKFDKIFIGFTLELFDTPEIPLVLEECKRVLKNNGLICLTSMSKRKINLMVRLYEFMHEIFPRQVDCRPIYASRVLRNAGFRIIDLIEQELFRLPVDIVTGKKQSS